MARAPRRRRCGGCNELQPRAVLCYQGRCQACYKAGRFWACCGSCARQTSCRKVPAAEPDSGSAATLICVRCKRVTDLTAAVQPARGGAGVQWRQGLDSEPDQLQLYADHLLDWALVDIWFVVCTTDDPCLLILARF